MWKCSDPQAWLTSLVTFCWEGLLEHATPPSWYANTLPAVAGGEPGLWLPWLRKGHLYQISESIRATTTEHTSPDGFSSADIDSHSSEAGSLKWRHQQTLHLVRTASWFIVPWSSLCLHTEERLGTLWGLCYKGTNHILMSHLHDLISTQIPISQYHHFGG